MNKKLFFTFLFALSFSVIQAQHLFNISLLGGVPQNSFAHNTDDFHLGLGLDVMFKVNPDFPFYLGIGYNYNAMGSKSQTIEEDLNVMAGSTVISTLPIKLGVQIDNGLSNWMLKTRLVFPTEYVKPYFQINGGLNYLYTKTTVTDETEKRYFTSDQDNNIITSKTAIDDLTYAYSGGGGLLIDAGRGCVELGVDYTWGGRATYFNKDQIKQWTVDYTGTGTYSSTDPKDIQLSSATATPYSSYTDVLYFHAGYTFKFGAPPPKKKPYHKPSSTSHTSSSHSSSSNKKPATKKH